MSVYRAADDADPIRTQGIGHVEERTAARSLLATGTLACPDCDAPVALPGRGVHPAEQLACPYCLTAAPVRDFLTLGEPTRPTRVVVRVIPPRARWASRR